MAAVRAPAVAGQFYPAEGKELTRLVDGYVQAATVPTLEPLAVIAPHAGYRWSGSVAAAAHRALAERGTPIERVVVAGPTHKVAVGGIGVTSATAFATPLGPVAIDTDAIEAIRHLPGVETADESQDREYSIEVQLPFIQRLIGDVPVVPLVISARAPAWLTADVLERLWPDDRTAVVVSSDLSHRQGLERARRIDTATTRLLEQLDVDAIGPARMCGAGAVRGLMKIALRRHLRVRALEVRNSGDFGADPEQVVGYGAYAFSSDPSPALTEDATELLLDLAERAARHRVLHDQPLDARLDDVPERLNARAAAFVSVHVGPDVRGCIGSVEPAMSLIETVAWAAGAAVEGRGWFTPITAREVDDIRIEIHVLSPMTRLHVSSLDELIASLRPGHDGLVMTEDRRRATYLPSVWEKINDPETFVTGLLAKGAFEEPWTKRRAAYRYSTEVLTSR